MAPAAPALTPTAGGGGAARSGATDADALGDTVAERVGATEGEGAGESDATTV